MAASSARTEFFKQLKPICVPLSRLAIRETNKTASANDVLGLLEELTVTWNAQIRRDAAVLDDKLADYVFFPITYVLRSQEQYPIRVIEATITLLRGLIQYGWKGKISKELAQQLVLFLTLVIGGAPGKGKGQRRDVPEETVLECLRTLNALISATGLSSSASSLLVEDGSMVALGHTVSVVLDEITDGANSEIQLEAASCIETFFTITGINNTLATFLPGTVSSLSKLLSPPLQLKVQRRVLKRCLDVLKVVLVNTLADMKTRALHKQMETTEKDEDETSSEDAKANSESQSVLTPAWLKATTAQVRIALASVLKLRNHESEDIRLTLDRVCIALLDECHASLANCRSMLVESAMVVENEATMKSVRDTSLQELASIYPELRDDIKTALYNWITTLPRLMQASDERIKQRAFRNILNGSKLVTALQLDSSVLKNSLGDALRDSIVTIMLSSKPPKVLDEAGADMNVWTNSELASNSTAVQIYRPVLLAQESQKSTREEMLSLISNVGSTTLQTNLAADMLSYLRDSEGVDQIATFWLSFELLKANYARSAELDSFLDLSSLGETEDRNTVFRELFDFSVSVLSSHSDSVEADWRLEALALEVTAFAASQMKLDFRPELIDVLYPVATFLGAQHPQLRAHAIITLNSITASCGYASVSELIVDNADYMVNSVSLRLNTFDISPASTKVLTMMIRLTGPRLIPFLDDVVAAIFAALDNYHGYPVFVETLFSVLSEVVTQGVKSDKLLARVEGSKPVDHRKRAPDSTSIADVLNVLEKRSKRARRKHEEETVEEIIRGHPQKPWGPDREKPKTFLETLEESAADSEAATGEEDPSAGTSGAVEKPKPPETPTYALLTRVATLTQHYLTAPAPALRRSLLELVATVSPALAPDEETFLPLVHALWPVLVTRLRDPEPFVVVAACRALAALCAAAGDFLASRFKTEWWDGLAKWCTRARDEAAKVSGRSPARVRNAHTAVASGGGGLLLATHTSSATTEQHGGEILIPGRSHSAVAEVPSASASAGSSVRRFAQSAQVWDAVVDLLAAIVGFVRLDDDVFDEILALLADELPRRGPHVRDALEAVNADAVWLALYERGHEVVGPPPAPAVVDGVVFVPVGPARGG